MTQLFPIAFKDSIPVSCCFAIVPIPYLDCAEVIRVANRRCRTEAVRGAIPEMFQKLDPLGPFANRVLAVSFQSDSTVLFNNGYPGSECYGDAYRLCRKIARQTFCVTSQPTIRFGKVIRMLAGLRFATFIPEEGGNPLKRSMFLIQESQRSWKFFEEGERLEIERTLFNADTRDWFNSTEALVRLLQASGYPVDNESAYGPDGIVITMEWMAKMPQHSMSLVQRHLRGENVEWSGSGGIG